MNGVWPSGAVAHPRRSFVVVAPPPRHPTGVLARGLWLSASRTPLRFRQQGVRERERATASAFARDAGPGPPRLSDCAADCLPVPLPCSFVLPRGKWR